MTTQYQYQNRLNLKNKLGRLLWGWVWLLLFRPTPRPLHVWRAFLLRLFGAKIGKNVSIYASARIWAPWNLTMECCSVLGDRVDCYSVGKIILGEGAIVSQDSCLCGATHDYTATSFDLVIRPIRIEQRAWVCARSFVAPGVTVGEGAVVAACAVVTKDVEQWTVVGGNPAKFIKKRVMKNNQ